MSIPGKNLFLVIVMLMLGSLACQTVLTPNVSSEQPPAVEVTQVVEARPTTPIAVVPNFVSLEGTLIELYERVNPGVVSIRVFTESGDGQGSGFIIDNQGHIVTNYHVVENAQRVEVDFPSGYKAYGNVLGSDLDSDLAVIKVDAPEDELLPLPMGDSESVRVGQTVVAIGNPFGLSGTMTIGIVSGKGRTLDSLRESPSGQYFTSGDVLQTDAAINPGNSGGPLLNLQGEVIGVNRAIRTGNFTLEGEPTSSGVGFAVSINIVKRVIPSLIEEGEYDYPYLGLSGLSEITLDNQEEFDIPRSTGVFVTFVEPGGPSARAGIKEGDLIIDADGKELMTFGDMISYLFNNKSPSEKVAFTLLRNGQEMEVIVTLGKRP